MDNGPFLIMFCSSKDFSSCCKCQGPTLLVVKLIQGKAFPKEALHFCLLFENIIVHPCIFHEISLSLSLSLSQSNQTQNMRTILSFVHHGSKPFKVNQSREKLPHSLIQVKLLNCEICFPRKFLMQKEDRESNGQYFGQLE